MTSLQKITIELIKSAVELKIENATLKAENKILRERIEQLKQYQS